MNGGIEADCDWSLDQWLNYQETLHAKSIDLGLKRVRKIAERLGVLTLPSRVITVAGTNGKGSTCALLSAILQQASYRVGVYSSPHLVRYNERVCLNDQPLEDALFCAAFAEIEAARAEISLSYFEFGTLAALCLFKKLQPDVVILEVGLGGRLDATNLIDADLAVITSIALDHCDWLGHDRESIGFEKAGVFRANRVAVCGEPDAPASIGAHASTIGARLFSLNQDFSAQRNDASWNYTGRDWQLDDLPLPQLPWANAVTALAALERFDLSVTKEAIVRGLQNASLIGRFQIIHEAPQVIADVGHNPHAAAYLQQRFAALPVEGKRYALVGMLRDKDIRTTLNTFRGCFDGWALCSLPGERGASALELRAMLDDAIPVNLYDDVTEGYRAELQSLGPKDALLVFGSFLTVTSILEYS